jgi:hypothetical protein
MTVTAAIDRSSVGASELTQRIALLRRFRDLLIQQRDRFRSYLAVLENQQFHIESGNAEELLSYVEMEEQIVADIFSIQKVIDPLEILYKAVIPNSTPSDVPALKAVLEDLKTQTITRSVHNRELLSTRMTQIRFEINALRNNPFVKASRSLYQSSGAASLIDIKG